MVNDYDQQNEIVVDGRRLRKIKRPKQYTAPISEPYAQGEYANNVPVIQQGQMYEQPQQQYVEDDAYTYASIPPEGGASVAYGSMDRSKVFIVAMISLLVGLLVGKFFFAPSTKMPSQSGLQGVVVNPEVPQGRSRCGMTEKTQGCVLYIMNPQRQELSGREFYDFASQLTGRPRFILETGNMRYSNQKIKPGFIAQINIPPLN